MVDAHNLLRCNGDLFHPDEIALHRRCRLYVHNLHRDVLCLQSSVKPLADGFTFLDLLGDLCGDICILAGTLELSP